MKVNGVEIRERLAGPADGAPVVLLHGFPLGLDLWEPQFAALESKYRVLAYDARGHGKSGTGEGPWAFEDMVDDLLGVLDTAGFDRAIVVGLSMGGYVALRFAEREAARVRALVLADTKSDADGDAAKLKRAGALRLLRAGGAKAFAESSLRTLLAHETMKGRPDVVEKVRAMIEACPAAGIAGALVAMAGRTDTTGSLERIAVPTLVLVGEKDGLTPPSDSKALVARIPGSRYVEIPGAGHLSSLENPGAFNAALLEFLAGLPPAK
jgi:3-oxoadipate enol-lactonase